MVNKVRFFPKEKPTFGKSGRILASKRVEVTDENKDELIASCPPVVKAKLRQTPVGFFSRTEVTDENRDELAAGYLPAERIVIENEGCAVTFDIDAGADLIIEQVSRSECLGDEIISNEEISYLKSSISDEQRYMANLKEKGE